MATFLHDEKRGQLGMEHPILTGAALAVAIDEIARAKLATNSDEAFIAFFLPICRTANAVPSLTESEKKCLIQKVAGEVL